MKKSEALCIYIKFFFLLLLLILFNFVSIYSEIQNLKNVLAILWIVMALIISDKKVKEILSFNNQLIITTTIFILLPFLLDDGRVFYDEYLGDYKSYKNIIKAFNIVILGNLFFWFGTKLVYKQKKILKKEKIDNIKIQKNLNIVYFILFVLANIEMIKEIGLTYAARTVLQSSRGALYTILPKIINLQYGSLLIYNIFNNVSKKKSILLLVLVMSLTIVSGDRASILSFIFVALYLYTKKMKESNLKLVIIFVTSLVSSALLYYVFVLIQAGRNSGPIDFSWKYDTFDFLLLGLYHYSDKSLSGNSFVKIFTNLIPRSFFPEKGVLLGKELLLISRNLPLEDYSLIGSSAIALPGDIYLNFGILGLLLMIPLGFYLKRKEVKFLESDSIYQKMKFFISLSYFYLIIRGDLVSQVNKYIISLIFLFIIYKIVMHINKVKWRYTH